MTTGTQQIESEAAGSPPDDWVPVEHRFAGLDRRTIAPSLGVLVFLLFLAFGLPAINGAISSRRSRASRATSWTSGTG